MALDEILRSIDLHMARGNELMVQIKESQAESDRRYREELDVTRQVIRRNELTFKHVGDQLVKMTAEMQEHREELREHREERREEREERRAERQGFLALIDELRGSGPTDN